MLGNGGTTSESRAVPGLVQSALFSGVSFTHVSIGNSHAMALGDNKVFSWGTVVSQLQFGPGYASGNQPFPVLLNTSSIVDTIIAIRAGYITSHVLTSTGNLFSVGGGSTGQMGDGTAQNSQVWRRLSSPNPVQQFDLYNLYGAATFNNSRLYTWGRSMFVIFGNVTAYRFNWRFRSRCTNSSHFAKSCCY